MCWPNADVLSCISTRMNKYQSSFEILKEILVEEPVLIQPTSGRDYTVYSDASRIVLGCVLMQDRKVVAYAFR